MESPEAARLIYQRKLPTMTVTIQMVVPSWLSGDFSCTAPGQSQTVYKSLTADSTVDIDIRDVASFERKGFTKAGNTDGSVAPWSPGRT